MNRVAQFFACLLLVYLVEWSASYFTAESVKTWYQELNKPFWTPPNWVFPLAWTFLYTCIGVSLWLVLPQITYKEALAFAVQLTLNFLWSFLFFSLQSPLLGLIGILLLFLAICVNISLFCPLSKGAALLLIPYLLWVGYAATLNGYIYVYN